MRKLKPIPAKECVVCRKTFQPKNGGHNALYCSDHCKLNKPKNVQTNISEENRAKARSCKMCGDIFLPSAHGYTAEFCGSYCKGKARRERDREKRPDIVSKRRRESYLRTKADPQKNEKVLERARLSNQKAREWLKNYKMERGCVDCGYKAHFAALEMDHEGEKRVEISIARSSIARLKDEIERGKCVVRCSNCHAVKTWERKQNEKTVKLVCTSA